MEALPGSSYEADDDQTKDKKKRKKERDGAKFSLPRFAAIEDKGDTDDSESSKPRHAKALADLLIIKREQAAAERSDSKDADSSKEAGKKDAEDSPTKDDDQGAETAELRDAEAAGADDTGAQKEEETVWPEQELGPTRLNAGEFVIDLSGETPVAERIIPLHSGPEAYQEQEQEPQPEVPESAQPAEPGPLRQQPEQQQYARDETMGQAVPEGGAEPEAPVGVVAAPEAVPTAAAGAEIPPVQPPEIPVLPFEQPPEPERPRAYHTENAHPEPAQAYREYVERQTAATRQAQADERVATKADVDDAVYYATKSGQNRGVLTGLLVGGAYEHFKHKRREKKAEKRFRAQSKQLEAARQDYKFGLRQQEKQRFETDARLDVAERRAESAEKRVAAEQARQAERQAQAPGEGQQLNIPPEHRLQTSAWHSIEIDAKTGKPVENPTFAYGHEYYRERAQEAIPALQRNAAAGEVALVAAAGTARSAGGTGMGPDSDSSLPPVNLPNATMQGAPSQTAVQPSNDDASKKQSAPAGAKSSSTPLWPWIVALLVIAICLAAALS